MKVALIICGTVILLEILNIIDKKINGGGKDGTNKNRKKISNKK